MSLCAILAVTVLMQAPDSSELFDTYVKSTQVFDHAEWRLRFGEKYSGPKPLNGTIIREGLYTIRRDRDRWKINFEGINRLLEKGRPRTEPEVYEICMPEKERYLQVGVDGKSKQPDSLIAYLHGLPADRPIGATIDNFMALLGYLPGNGQYPLEAILRESSLSVHEGRLDGRPAWRLAAATKYGKVNIWFDADEQRLVRQIDLEKSGDDLSNKIAMKDMPEQPGSSFYPNGRLMRSAEKLRFEKYEQKDGRAVPREALLETTRVFTGDQKVTIQYQMVVEEFKAVDSFEKGAFDISTAIPEGFNAQVQDEPNIEYQWRSGKVVKAVSDRTLSNLLAGWFDSAFSPIGYFVVFAVILTAVSALSVWSYRRRVA